MRTTKQQAIDQFTHNVEQIEAAPDSPRKAALLPVIPEVREALVTMTDEDWRRSGMGDELDWMRSIKFLRGIGAPIASAMNTTR